MLQKITKVAIVGATGYTGVELVRILVCHPYVQLTYLTSESYANTAIGDVYPDLAKYQLPVKLTKLDIAQLVTVADVVFLALPHGKSAAITKSCLQHGQKVIDLSADLRLKDPKTYQIWYQTPADAELLAQAVYGLPEVVAHEHIRNAQLIANPGCYPTSAILALAPAISNQVINLDNIIIDSKSGVSGSGRSLNIYTQYCEVSENFSAYQVGGIHRHIPEMEQQLSILANQAVHVEFTPHLVPMIRGMLTTVYANLRDKVDIEEVLNCYQKYYANAHFIRINQDIRVQTKSVCGSNYCQLSLHINPRTQKLIIISVIDNLLKGASGQAIQNFNIMQDYAETMAL